MKKTDTSDTVTYIDVRYNKSFSISLFIASLVLITPVILEFETSPWWNLIFLNILRLIIGLFILIEAIKVLIGRKYFALDINNSILIIYGSFGFKRKKHFDRIYADEKDIYLETNGKKKIQNIYQILCNKSDYEALKQVILKI